MISQKIEIDVVILKSISIFKITTRIFAFSGAESSFKDTLFEFRSTILQWRTSQTYVIKNQIIIAIVLMVVSIYHFFITNQKSYY